MEHDRRVERRKRARRAEDEVGLSGVVQDLADEVHALRGTLQAFAPREEVKQEIEDRVDDLAGDLRGIAVKVEQRSQRRIAAMVVVLALLGAGTMSGFVALRLSQQSYEHASLVACQERKVLENHLATLVLGLAENADPSNASQLEAFADALNTTPCLELLNAR